MNLETAILKSILDHVCATQPVRAGQCFAMGISAGGAMSLTLALRYPQTFVAVASHSGAAPNSAGTLIQAGQTLRGGRLPDVEELAQRLAQERLPPLLVLHGDADLMVAPANGDAAVGLWLTLAAGHGKITSSSAELARGTRYPCTGSTGSSTASRLQGCCASAVSATPGAAASPARLSPIRAARMPCAWPGNTSAPASRRNDRVLRRASCTSPG